MAGEGYQDAPTGSGLSVVLSPDEYRLALLGLVDFEAGAGGAGWQGLQAAAAFVTDGPAKARLIRERLLPITGQLAELADAVDSLALLAARHWFRHGTVGAGLDAEIAQGESLEATA